MTTDHIGAAIAAAESVQPQADTTIPEVTPETNETKPEPEPEDNTPWPKKAQNALSEQKGKAAKWRETARQERAEKDALIAEITKLKEVQQPQQSNPLSAAKTGIPTKLDANKFSNWAEYSEARAEEIADYKIDQKLTERDNKQKETQVSTDEKTWETERSQVVDKQGEEFAKEHPEIIQIFNENAEIIKSFPKEIKHALLAADNAPLALLNLAKEGKLEDLGEMSLVDAKVEIRLAQMQAPIKPKTKAPTPMPASRGSVPAGKRLEDLTPREALEFLKPKD